MSDRFVRGRVVDEQGRPIEGVDVRLYRPDPAKPGSRRSGPAVRTGADGCFEFGPSPETESGVALGAWPQVDQPYRSRNPCEPAADDDTTIVLGPGAGVRVRAIDTAGAPLDAPGWNVTVRRERLSRADGDRLRAVYERLLAEGTSAEGWEAALADAGIDVEALRLPGDADGIGSATHPVRDGMTEFSGLACGTHSVCLFRWTPGAARPAIVELASMSVESGDAEIADGRLVLRGPATVVVRVAADVG